MTAKSAPGGKACRYAWLLFDADGTLFDYDRAETTALARTFERAAVPFDLAYVPVYRQINSALWKALERKEISPAALKVKRFKDLFEALGLPPAPPDVPEVYLECLAECSELVPGALELFATLEGRCQIAVVTNGLRKVQRPRIERSLIRHHIRHLVISEEIGSAKPAPEFFDHVLEKLRHPPKSQVLMIGDNWGADIAGAASYGLDTCWYNPSRSPRPASPPITLEIAALSELGEWLLRVPS